MVETVTNICEVCKKESPGSYFHHKKWCWVCAECKEIWFAQSLLEEPGAWITTAWAHW